MKEKLQLALLTFLLKAIAIWPLRVLYVLSDLIYPLVYYVAGYRREVVRKNLTHSFPEKTEQEIARLDSAIEAAAADYLELTRLIGEKETAETELLDLMEQWEAAQE